MNNIEAVIFDFDGVIGDTMQDNCKAWKLAFDHFNFSMKDEEYYQLEGMGRFQIAEHFIETYQLDRNIKNEVVELKELSYKNNNNFKIYDKVFAIFELLHSKNIKTAIVTGASRDRISEHLDASLNKQLTALVTADDVKHTKPHPEPYLKAIEKLETKSKNCLVIENAIFGIQSAKSAGCMCFALETTLNKTFLKEADEVFANHNQLLVKFISLFN